MMIFGHTSSDDLSEALPATANDILSSEFTPLANCLVSKLSVPADGLSTGGDQELRGVIYSAAGDLLGQSEPYTVMNLDEPKWIDLVFAAPVPVTGEEACHLGVHAGETSGAARLFHTNTGTNLSTVADTYSDGADPSGFTPSNTTGELGIYATFAYAWEPPAETDLYLANLGFQSAQSALSGVGDPRTKQRAYATWHGTFLDPEPQGASLAIVQSGGPLSGLVGERIKVTSASQRSVVVYVHRETDLDLDDETQISLSRRAWQALAPAGDDTLLVTTEAIRTGDA
jgi:hypothetical protein